MFWQVVSWASWENPLFLWKCCKLRLGGGTSSVCKERKKINVIDRHFVRQRLLLMCTNQMERQSSTVITRSWQANYLLSAVYDVKVLTEIVSLKTCLGKERKPQSRCRTASGNIFFHVHQIIAVTFWKFGTILKKKLHEEHSFQVPTFFSFLFQDHQGWNLIFKGLIKVLFVKA